MMKYLHYLFLFVILVNIKLNANTNNEITFIFYLNKLDCFSCITSSLKSNISLLNNNILSRNIIVLKNYNKDYSYYLSKIQGIDTVITDDFYFNEFLDLNDNYNISLAIFNKENELIYLQEDLQNNPIKDISQLNDENSINKNKKKELYFDKLYDYQYITSDANNYYLTNIFENKAYIYNKNQNKFLHDSVLNYFYFNFVDHSSQDWVNLINKNGNYQVIKFFNRNDSIYLNAINFYEIKSKNNENKLLQKQFIYQFTGDAIANHYTIKEDNRFFMPINMFDNKNIFCLYAYKDSSDMNNYIIDNPNEELPYLTHGLFNYNINDSVYYKICNLENKLNGYNRKDLAGIGELIRFKDKYIYYNVYLDVFALIDNKNIYDLKKITSLINVEYLQVAPYEHMIIDSYYEKLYIIQYKYNSVNLIYQFNEDFELEAVYKMPDIYINTYEKIHFLKANKSSMEFLIRDDTLNWFKIKLPYLLLVI